jgi:polysaccharide biosynthesis/export protein
MKKIYFVFALFLTSCASKRDLVYFSNLSKKSLNNSAIMNNIEPKIQPRDVLNITVNTQSSESDILFTANNNSRRNIGAIENEGYRVSQAGDVNFPVLGNVKLEGLTLEEAQKKLTQELKNYVKSPIVNINYSNFKITVIGEVNHPSTFTIQNEKINLLEALGMAGDMTYYGKRENVLVIRENDGNRTMMRVNLNKQEVLNSPYFYLKQNDVIYVEPDKAKAVELSPNNRLMPLLVATISAMAVITTTFLRR